MSLTIKLIIAFVLVSVLPISAITFFTFTRQSQVLETQTINDLKITGSLAESNVLLFFEKIKARTADWSADGYIRQQTEAISVSSSPELVEALNLYIKNERLPLDSTILLTDVLDVSGNIIASSDATRIGGSLLWQNTDEKKDKKKQLYELNNFLLVNGAGFGKAFVSEITINEGIAPDPMLSVISPLKSINNEDLIGILVNHISTSELNKILLGKQQGNIGYSDNLLSVRKSAEWYLVNRSGYMITPSRFSDNTLFTKRILTPPAVSCLLEKNDYSGKYQNYLGTNVLGVSFCPSGQWWSLIAEISEEEAMSGIRTMQKTFMSMLVPVVAFIIIFSVVFGIRLISRSQRNLVVLKELGRGNFEARVETSGKDAISLLGNAINETAAQIQQLILQSRESEAKYRVLLDELDESLLISDRRGRLIDANKKALALLQVDKDTLLKMGLENIMRTKESQDILEKVINKAKYQLKIHLLLKGGKEKIVSITASAIKYVGSSAVRIKLDA